MNNDDINNNENFTDEEIDELSKEITPIPPEDEGKKKIPTALKVGGIVAGVAAVAVIAFFLGGAGGYKNGYDDGYTDGYDDGSDDICGDDDSGYEDADYETD